MKLSDWAWDAVDWLVDRAAEGMWQLVFAAALGGTSVLTLFKGYEERRLPTLIAGLFFAFGSILLIARRFRSEIEILPRTENNDHDYYRIRVSSRTRKMLHIGAKITLTEPDCGQTLPIALQFTHDDEEGGGSELVPLDGKGTLPIDVFRYLGPESGVISLRGRVHKPDIPNQAYVFTIKVYSESGSVERQFRYAPNGSKRFEAL